ncbi:LLM class flavin-dependent oxidoreductase [Nocardia tengchongensis]|uniref:LLM class flavin-dependent oxidoreductase n=1 Tax=Nocardia tengchongensis TaxID=2055889 RepID=UPI00367A4DEA
MWSVHHDLRAPAFGTPAEVLYGAALEISEWADMHDASSIILSEHHGAADGYLPSALTMAAAVAARTSRARITVAALILTLRDPVGAAEDALVVDLISRGRLTLVAVPGYVPDEFDMFDLEFDRRGRIFEEKLDIFVRALTGEAFEHRGRNIVVTPPPVQRPRPMVLVGGSAPKRAARLADGFMPAVDDPALTAAYRAERRRLGKPEGIVGRAVGPKWVFVTEDPDKAWSQLEPHVLHEVNAYGAWSAPVSGASPYQSLKTLDDVRSSGLIAVVTPEECVDLAHSFDPALNLVFKPLVAGLDPEIGWASLQLFVDKVLPAL